MAGMKLRLDFDFAGAAPLFRSALEQAPNDPRVLGNTSIFEGNLGNLEKSLSLLDKATQLDPLHQTLLLNLGIRNAQVGRYEDADIALRSLLQLNPDFLSARGYLGDVYLWQKRPKAAMDEFELEGFPAFKLGGLARAHHDLGNEAESRAALEELESSFGDDAAVETARTYAYLGDGDRAFDWLERALKGRQWASDEHQVRSDVRTFARRSAVGAAAAANRLSRVR